LEGGCYPEVKGVWSRWECNNGIKQRDRDVLKNNRVGERSGVYNGFWGGGEKGGRNFCKTEIKEVRTGGGKGKKRKTSTDSGETEDSGGMKKTNLTKNIGY